MFIPVNINSIVLFSCEVQKIRTWIFLQSYQSMSLSFSIHSSSSGREPVCERHTWTAVVGTGLVVVFFQPSQLAGVVLGYFQFAYPIAYLVFLIASWFVLISSFDSMISLILRRVVYKVSMYITKLLNLAVLVYSSNAIFFSSGLWIYVHSSLMTKITSTNEN